MFPMTNKHRRFAPCSQGMPMRLRYCANWDVNGIRNCDVVQPRVFRQAGPMRPCKVGIANRFRWTRSLICPGHTSLAKTALFSYMNPPLVPPGGQHRHIEVPQST